MSRQRSQTMILSLESKSSIFTRFITYLGFFVIIFGLGLPIWQYTTTIPQEPLLIDKMLQYENNIKQMIKVEVPVYVNLPSNSMSQLLTHGQKLINEELKNYKIDFQYGITLINCNGDESLDPLTNYIVNIKPSDIDRESFSISPFSKEITIFTTNQLIATNHVADFLAKILIKEVFSYELEMYNNKNNLAFETGANYHLSFFLLNGDGNYISWDFEDFYNEYLINFVELINTFANFTIDSQVEYYTGLTTVPTFNESTQSYLLYEHDTSVFVNHEKWNLDNNVLISNSNDKSLTFMNMILYVPSKEFQPLEVFGSETNSFITPQYGGIQILNLNHTSVLTVDELKPIFEIFISQILNLLGFPKSPKSPFIRLDFLTRYFIVKNLIKSTNNLGSLVRLIESLPSISIPNNTQAHVTETFDSIDTSIKYLKNFDLKRSCEFANNAFIESNSAFFEKDMIQQIYFPDEHKFAVYSPLLGPIFTIMILGLIRISKDIKVLKKHYWNKPKTE